MLGNLFGGYVFLLYILVYLEKVKIVCLIGSFGFFENVMGNLFFCWGDYEFICKKIEIIFFDFKVVFKEFVDEVYNMVNDCNWVIWIIVIVKFVVWYNFSDKFD